MAVNQNGERVQNENINILTVIANEVYEEFVSGLQSEIEKETGITFGKIEDHVFAKLAFIDGETEEQVSLGLIYRKNYIRN